MFDTRRKLRRYEAACFHYEDQLMKKNKMLKETEDLLSYVRQLNENLQECNDALTSENRRLAENADLDSDMMDEMYAEYTNMLRKDREHEKLVEENDRLWTENILLKAELLKLAPEKLKEIGHRG